jgi:nitroreductase
MTSEPRSPGRPAGSDIVNVILGRRSTREGYLDRPVPDGTVEAVVRCGLAGPSSKNAQPWRLHVVRDRALLQELADTVAGAAGADTYVPEDPRTGRPREQFASTVSESADVLRQAPCAIFVENMGAFSDGRRNLADIPHEHLPGALVGYTFEVIGLGAAIENMWLAARSLGLGVAFMGDILVAENAIKERLGVERDLVGVLVLGFVAPPQDGPPTRVIEPRDPSRTSWHD